PFVDVRHFLHQPTWPDAVHQHTSTVPRRRLIVDALQLQGHVQFPVRRTGVIRYIDPTPGRNPCSGTVAHSLGAEAERWVMWPGGHARWPHLTLHRALPPTRDDRPTSRC